MKGLQKGVFQETRLSMRIRFVPISPYYFGKCGSRTDGWSPRSNCHLLNSNQKLQPITAPFYSHRTIRSTRCKMLVWKVLCCYPQEKIGHAAQVMELSLSHYAVVEGLCILVVVVANSRRASAMWPVEEPAYHWTIKVNELHLMVPEHRRGTKEMAVVPSPRGTKSQKPHIQWLLCVYHRLLGTSWNTPHYSMIYWLCFSRT